MKIEKDGSVHLYAPVGTPKGRIEEFVSSHRRWLERNTERVRVRQELQSKTDASQLDSWKDEARKILPERVGYYSRVMGVVPEGIRITSAKTRFGSCSPKNRICFSLYLMAYPPEAIDYVVVHELAHISFKNHGKEFYDFISGVMPDYKRRAAMLKNGIL